MKRLVLSLMDQGLISALSALTSILIAQNTSVDEFGTFGLLFSMYVLIQSLSQSLNGQIVLIESGELKSSSIAVDALSNAVVLGLIASLGFALFGLLSDADPAPFIAFALATPALLAQDLLRSAAYAERKSAVALTGDISWVLLQAGVSLALIVTGNASLTSLVVTWGLSSLAASTWFALKLKLFNNSRRMPKPVAFMLLHRKISVPLVAQMATVMGALQITYFAVSGIAGLTAMAGIRGAQTVMGPITVASNATVQFSVPEIRKRSMTRQKYQAWAIAIAFSLFAVFLAWGLTWSLLPNFVGAWFLGDTWQLTQETIFAMAVFMALQAATTGPSVIFRARKNTSTIFALNLIYGPSMLLFGITGAFIAGGTAAIWGMALAAGGMTPLWWLSLRKELRKDNHEA